MTEQKVWYFTFGYGHYAGSMSLAKRFMKFHGTWGEARQKMIGLCGLVWGFQYSEKAFLPQMELYGLTEVTVEEYEEAIKGD